MTMATPSLRWSRACDRSCWSYGARSNESSHGAKWPADEPHSNVIRIKQADAAVIGKRAVALPESVSAWLQARPADAHRPVEYQSGCSQQTTTNKDTIIQAKPHAEFPSRMFHR